LTLKEFETLVAKADAALKPLPSTAQVAEQMGHYLGVSLNQVAKDKGAKVSGFKYSHFGSLAKLGSQRAAADLPAIQQAWTGFWTWYMWAGVFLGQQYSFRNRFLVVNDWMKTWFFGRDISRF
jgi:NADH:ubiquinone reductase (non-electrogenic)